MVLDFKKNNYCMLCENFALRGISENEIENVAVSAEFVNKFKLMLCIKKVIKFYVLFDCKMSTPLVL